MYFVNYLNRNKTDPYYPAFEVIYGIELIFIVSTLIAGCVVVFLVHTTTKLHRLIRLRMMSAIVVAMTFVVSRLLVMHHEYFGPMKYVEAPVLIVGSIFKQVFLGYMTALTSILALDRWISMRNWAWYESGTNSTLLFFALQEAILFSISITIGYLLVYGRIRRTHVILCFAAFVLIGANLAVLVYRRNRRELRELRRGAVVNHYSVSRAFQIRENVSLLAAFAKIARPLVIACIPPFLFSPIYQIVPPGIGYDGLRYFAASMYDLWLSIASVTIIALLPVQFPSLKQHLRRATSRRIYGAKQQHPLPATIEQSAKRNSNGRSVLYHALR